MKLSGLPKFLPKEIVRAINEEIASINNSLEENTEIKEVIIKNQRFYVKFVDYLKNLYN